MKKIVIIILCYFILIYLIMLYILINSLKHAIRKLEKGDNTFVKLRSLLAKSLPITNFASFLTL